MKFSIACSWDNKLLDGLKDIDKKYPGHQFELFGALKESFGGSAHSALAISGKCRTKKEIEKYTNKIHKSGFKFNYTLNSTCLGNQEYTLSGHKAIMEQLEWISSFSDAITIAIPYLIELVKNNFNIEVVASTVADINTVRKALYFEQLGGDRITLSFMINRNFKLLELMRSKIKAPLEILVNDSCLLDCPYRNYHYNLGSHASQLKDNFYFDYPVAKCLLERLKNPSEYLRSPWIRPEDLKIYKDLADVFKIAGREKSTAWILNAVHAYVSGSYQGNLLDIMTMVSPASHPLGEIWFKNSPQIYLDNLKLKDFIKKFLVKNCADCSDCGYCKKYAEKSLSIEEDKKEVTLTQIKKLIDFMFNFDTLKNKKMVPWLKRFSKIYLKKNLKLGFLRYFNLPFFNKH